MFKLKTVFFAIFISFYLTCAVMAAQVSLIWNAGTGEPKGYKIYYGTSSGNYPYVIDVGNKTTHVVTGLQDSTNYYFIVKAYNDAGESLPSNEFSWAYFPNDTDDPQVTIIGPSTSTLPSITLSGTASDNQSVASVTWSTDNGQSGTASGTSNWSISGVLLSEGINQITVTANDSSGNSGSASISVQYQPDADMHIAIFGDTPDATYSGTIEDTFLRADDATNYSDSFDMLPVYTWPAGTNANSPILKIDVSNISKNAQIQSAILYLYNMNVFGTGGDQIYEISAHKIINVNPIVSSASWMYYDGSNSWSGGSNGGVQDIAPAESVSQIDMSTGYKSWDITQMVRDWVADPTSNFGVMLRSDIENRSASVDTNRIFSPSENENPNFRPKLILTFSGDSSQQDPNLSAPPSPGGLRISD